MLRPAHTLAKVRRCHPASSVWPLSVRKCECGTFSECLCFLHNVRLSFLSPACPFNGVFCLLMDGVSIRFVCRLPPLDMNSTCGFTPVWASPLSACGLWIGRGECLSSHVSPSFCRDSQTMTPRREDWDRDGWEEGAEKEADEGDKSTSFCVCALRPQKAESSSLLCPRV